MAGEGGGGGITISDRVLSHHHTEFAASVTQAKVPSGPTV